MNLGIVKASNHFIFIVYAVVALVFLCGSSVLAVTDYIFLSVNGDTTMPAMVQGDELIWGANCATGATVNWEIWFDVNSNANIDPMTDILLTSENITDGNPVTEVDPILDG